ncbi:MAG: PilZ domain-containing protein [Syntrophobacteraceae bacterium]
MRTVEEEKKAREYSRVDAFLPLQTRIVLPEEQRSLRSRISREPLMIHNTPLPELKEEALFECLTMINNKLDAIINFLNLEKSGISLLTLSEVNISGNGLSFESNEEFGPEDVLELKLSLSTSPELMLYIYGEVVRSEPGVSCRYRTSVTFTIIDEDIRERIVKFVFERQREILRNQRRL